MKKTVATLWALATFAMLAPAVPAMDMNHDTASTMSSMQMQGDEIMLHGTTVDGVSAMAHLKDIRAAMAKMNMPQTHHFMVMFTDAKTGTPVESGMAAVKVTDPSGATGKPVKLMAMAGGFGADVTLDKPGAYTFEVGTRLTDGKKRKFTFHYTMP